MNKFVDDIIDKIGRQAVITWSSHKFGLAELALRNMCCYTKYGRITVLTQSID